jgi:hypothetical protein
MAPSETGNGSGSHELAKALQDRVDAATVAQAEAAARTAQANARAAEVKADSDGAAARLALAKSFVPDLGSVKPDTTDVKASTPSLVSLLSFAALKKISEKIADEVDAALPADAAPVLVTAELDLATADASYVEVDRGISHLIEAADKLLSELEPPAEDTEAVQEMPALPRGGLMLGSSLKFVVGAAGLAATAFSGGVAAPAVLAGEAAAAVIPGLLSLLGRDSTLLAGTMDASDAATTAGVSGSLKQRRPDLKVIHDDFRLLPQADVLLRVDELADNRVQLTTWELKLTTDKGAADKKLADLQAAEQPDARQIAEVTEQSTILGAKLKLVQTMGTTIDAFTTGINVVSPGAKRSPLETAALHEELHDRQGRFGYVLFVKANTGDVDERIIQRRIVFVKDSEFSSAADITVTYMLLETGDSSIVSAGSVTGVVHAHGSVGSKPKVDPPEIIQ